MKNEKGLMIEQKVQYDWKLALCKYCKKYDHEESACRTQKLPKLSVNAPVNVKEALTNVNDKSIEKTPILDAVISRGNDVVKIRVMVKCILVKRDLVRLHF